MLSSTDPNVDVLEVLSGARTRAAIRAIPLVLLCHRGKEVVTSDDKENFAS